MSDAVHPPIQGGPSCGGSFALEEDLTPLGDITSGLLPAGVMGRAEFVMRTPGVVAGLACATEAFAQVDASVTVDWLVADDGDAVVVGQRGCSARCRDGSRRSSPPSAPR